MCLIEIFDITIRLNKMAYQQPIITSADLSISQQLLKWIIRFLAIFSLLLVGLSVLLYFQG